MDDNFTTWERQFWSSFTSSIIAHLDLGVLRLLATCGDDFGDRGFISVEITRGVAGVSSAFSCCIFRMIHDINSPSRHQDDIGATLDDIYTTLDDTFFHMNFASVIMLCRDKRNRKAPVVLSTDASISFHRIHDTTSSPGHGWDILGHTRTFQDILGHSRTFFDDDKTMYPKKRYTVHVWPPG